MVYVYQPTLLEVKVLDLSLGMSTPSRVPVKEARRISMVTISMGELDTGNRKAW